MKALVILAICACCLLVATLEGECAPSFKEVVKQQLQGIQNLFDEDKKLLAGLQNSLKKAIKDAGPDSDPYDDLNKLLALEIRDKELEVMKEAAIADGVRFITNQIQQWINLNNIDEQITWETEGALYNIQDKFKDKYNLDMYFKFLMARKGIMLGKEDIIGADEK